MPVTISTIGSPQRITLKNDESVLNPNEISTRKSSKREPERERKSEKRQSQPPTIRNTQDFIQVPMGSPHLLVSSLVTPVRHSRKRLKTFSAQKPFPVKSSRT